jgi:hypothetical protein
MYELEELLYVYFCLKMVVMVDDKFPELPEPHHRDQMIGILQVNWFSKKKYENKKVHQFDFVLL